MAMSATKNRGSAGGKKARAKSALGLPPKISTLDIEGKRYYLTPASEMAEWLEDLEDVVDSIEAMRDVAEAVPWEEVRASLCLTGSEPRRTPAQSRAKKK